MRVIYMTSKEFVKDFSKRFNPKKFNYILISRDIDSDESMKTVIAVPELCPPASTTLSIFVDKGYCKKYVKAYKNYMETPEIKYVISILARMSLECEKDIIYLCSEREAEYRFVELILGRIQDEYGLTWMTYKEFLKKPDKHMKEKKSPRVAMALIQDDIRKFEKYQYGISRKIRIAGYAKQLEKLNNKDLYLMAYHRGLISEKQMRKEKPKRKKVEAKLLSAGKQSFPKRDNPKITIR